jgi:AcrR family transcriptional regulator
MTPRPRKASDEEIFAATQRIMTRLAPGEWTLADIAAEAGLTAGALVQRFGSKRGLMVALTEAWSQSAAGFFVQIRTGTRSPLDALRVYADCMAEMGQSPSVFAHHLSYLQLDLTDPDLHKHVRAQSVASRAAIRGLLDEAIAAGELRDDVDSERLARMVEVVLSGSLMTWAFYQEGDARTWMRHDLDSVLQPFMAGDRKGGKRVTRIRKGK